MDKPYYVNSHFFVDFWERAGQWSNNTFGPPFHRGPHGPLDHLKKEIEEVLKDPTDIDEYVDCFFLIIDAARRAGKQPVEFMDACWDKLSKNQTRKWPDWRTADPNKAIEHDRRCGKPYWIGAAINNCKRFEGHSGECNDGSYDSTAPANGDTEDKGMKFS